MNISRRRAGPQRTLASPALVRLWLALLAVAPAGFADEPVTYGYRVVESFPHARNVFTQGLVFDNERLYESAGQYGESRLLVRRLDDTRPLAQRNLKSELFAEGITLLAGRIYQLTWRSGRGFIYDAQTLDTQGEFAIDGEGWGITHNNTQLIVSDGTDALQFIDPKSFRVTKRLAVKHDDKPVHRLNELEWVDGLIYANIWQSNWIVMIDPDSGMVVGKVRLAGLLPGHLKTANTDVLNGIAFDSQRRRLLVTGKYWPRIYHIELTAEQ